jgi:hypothetical protein
MRGKQPLTIAAFLFIITLRCFVTHWGVNAISNPGAHGFSQMR